MKPRWKILIALAGAVGAVILLPVVRHYQLKAATNAYIAQLEAQGEPMDLAQVLPPPVPPERNGADIIRQAGAWIDTNTSLLETDFDIPAMHMVAPGKAMIGWQQPEVRGETATNSWQEIAAAIARNTNVFVLLHQVINKPDFDFQIPYNHGLAALNFPKFELPESKRAAEWLQAAAMSHLHSGDTASAVDDVRTMLSLIQALRDERFAISELVRIAMARIAVGPTWEILQSPSVTDAQLAQLQNDWANLDFVKSGEYALAMERVTSRIDLAEWRASPSKFAGFLNKGSDSLEAAGLYSDEEESSLTRASMKSKIFMWEYWWSYPDELLSLKGSEVLLTSMRMAQTNDSFDNAMDFQFDELYKLRLTNEDDFASFSPNPDFHSFLSEDIPLLGGFLGRVRSAIVARQMVTTAIALKRYQLKHGNYPPNLNALVREFLPAVPLDPVDGKPLQYHPGQDGTWLLYSVGFNDKDDGGNPALEKGVEDGNMSWLNNHALDWVWPQPATAAEIQNYWAHPPK